MAIRGIGGAFITTEDPDGMATWYEDAFSIGFQDFGDGTRGHVFTGDGPMAGAVLGLMKARSPVPRMPKDAPLSEPYGDQPFMVNLKTDDLAGLVKHLQAMDTDVRMGPVAEGIGSFAWVTDPEGNRIELWQPE